jgi:hypothetical protein
LEPLKLEPLAADKLSAAVAGIVAGPSAAKQMAVRGMAPLRPLDLLIAVYQLTFDADPQVSALAEAAPLSLPDKIIVGALADHLPAQVLHFFADKLPQARGQAIEKILYNADTLDATFVLLAQKLDENALEIIFQNELRLLRTPAIVGALYFNKNSRMSSVRRALELCARNHVKPEGIPSFDEVAAEILSEPNASIPAVLDQVFRTVIAAETADPGTPLAAESAQAQLPPLDVEKGTGAPEKAKAQNTSFIKFDELKIFEKVRLATVGNAYCRQVLIRDSNRLVAMAVIRSPSITDREVLAAAANRGICDDVIRYIANSREFTKDYAVKSALLNNPKCPLALSLRLMPFMHPEDLRALSRSKNIPSALSTAARKLIQTRSNKE